MKKQLVLLILVFLSLQLFAQPCTKVNELNRKRHQVNGMIYGHPYTTFDRHNGKTLPETIDIIRARIKREIGNKDNSVLSAYKLIYNHANTYLPPNSGNIQDDGLIKVVTGEGGGSTPSDRALWAKNCAFVMLIGLDGNGDSLSLSQRNAFKYKAIQAFDNLNGEIPS